jgi:hypothetical protein
MTAQNLMRGAFVTLALPFCVSTALAADLPLNPDVTQTTITTTICQAGWTRTVRPYVANMKRIKSEMLAPIGEPIERRNQYELDHKIPLALGGAVIDRRNLALQPIEEAREKDAIEVCLSSLVCEGKIGCDARLEGSPRVWDGAAYGLAVMRMPVKTFQRADSMIRFGHKRFAKPKRRKRNRNNFLNNDAALVNQPLADDAIRNNKPTING